MKIIFLLIVVQLFLFNSVSSQLPFYKKMDGISNAGIKRNFENNIVLKINPLRLALGDFNVSCEKQLFTNTSINGRVQFHPMGFLQRKIDNWFISGNDYSFEINEKPRINYFGTDVDYRFYFNEEKVLTGFYCGPYLSYSFFNTKIIATYGTSVNSKPITVLSYLNLSFNNFEIGGQAGYHWIISENFSVDWSFAGVGLDFVLQKSSIGTDNLGESIERFADDLSETLTGLSLPISSFLKIENVNVHKSFDIMYLIPGFKSSITIGYVF